MEKKRLFRLLYPDNNINKQSIIKGYTVTSMSMTLVLVPHLLTYIIYD